MFTADQLKEKFPKLYKFNINNPNCVVCATLVPLRYMPHHWKSRKSGGTDDDLNLDRCCMIHHQQIEKWGMKKSAIEFKLPKPRQILINVGKWTKKDEEEYNR